MASDRPGGTVRLQKVLAMGGVASRRAAARLIVEGRVTVNGAIVRAPGAQADPRRDEIRVDGRRVRLPVRLRYLLLNKPAGYVTTRRDPEGRPTVLDLLPSVREYVYPVGRLDYDSEGLLLLTNDGELAARLTHPRHGVPRVYEAIVRGAPDSGALERLRRGVVLDGRRTAPAEVVVKAARRRGGRTASRLLLTLREGRRRQVRRMCAAVGVPLLRLRRLRLGPLALGSLPVGAWRDLTPAEVAALRRAAAGSPRVGTHGPSAGSGGSSSSGRSSSGTGFSTRSPGGSKPSAWARSSMRGSSDRSFRPKRTRNSRVVP